jgi:hypothetical protein
VAPGGGTDGGKENKQGGKIMKGIFIELEETGNGCPIKSWEIIFDGDSSERTRAKMQDLISRVLRPKCAAHLKCGQLVWEGE